MSTTQATAAIAMLRVPGARLYSDPQEFADRLHEAVRGA
jgi:hypothetical protein